MSTTVTKKGSVISNTWSPYIKVVYDSAYSATQAKATVTVGVYYNKKHNHGVHYDTAFISGVKSTNTSIKNYTKSGTYQKDAGSYLAIATRTLYFNKSTSAYTGKVMGGVGKGGGDWQGASQTSYSFTVPALAKYTIKYNGNKTGAKNVPGSQAKYYGKNITLSKTKPTVEDWTFTKWNTAANGSGTSYAAGATFKANANTTLYGQWSNQNPPYIDDIGEPTVSDYATENGNAINGFSTIKVPFTGAKSRAGKKLDSVKLVLSGSSSQTVTIDLSGSSLTEYSGEFSFTPNVSGTFDMTVTVTDNDSPKRTEDYSLGGITISAPTWTKECSFTTPQPVKSSNGSPLLASLKVKNYIASEEAGEDVWDTYPVGASSEMTVTDDGWSFPLTFTAAYVSDPTSVDPDTDVMVEYTHYDIEEKASRGAFFGTSRNQNFSNGIYNMMFVSGVDASEHPTYTSRAWWSAANNPLYFPDTNYVEVGSNDTGIQGLTKVEDYLGVVKKSTTTDTAIYLLYPTSFEEDTTFAVKQGVQGVGALAKYAFNILGDETLFLSPNGVMAIAPDEDKDHNVKNRSYYVDGRLLKENSLESAFSFVYDGMYWLAVNGRCYVLDGNQRNSWGNDRTNLVYECYYLENIPALCFAKFNDVLVFSTGQEICQFKTGDGVGTYLDDFLAGTDIIYEYTEQDIDEERYEERPTDFFYYDNGEYVRCTDQDAYDPEKTYYTRASQHEVTYVPVEAEWSTVLDDDGAVHYYKTMQKKGNVVSILPTDFMYVIVEVTEEEYEANPRKYYTFDGTNYNRCTIQEPYDADETYYIRGRSSTKVFIKKDEDDPYEIERSFNESSNIPSEMYLKKKVKKYKRLQFIVRNEVDEPFGLDSIIKNYTLGSYAKR